MAKPNTRTRCCKTLELKSQQLRIVLPDGTGEDVIIRFLTSSRGRIQLEVSGDRHAEFVTEPRDPKPAIHIPIM